MALTRQRRPPTSASQQPAFPSSVDFSPVVEQMQKAQDLPTLKQQPNDLGQIDFALPQWLIWKNHGVEVALEFARGNHRLEEAQPVLAPLFSGKPNDQARRV